MSLVILRSVLAMGRPLIRIAFAGRGLQAALYAVAIVFAGGCSSGWGYDRIALGSTPSAYERALPLDGVRRTESGMCWTGPGGAESDVVVVMTSADGRVSAKFRVSAAQSGEFGAPRYAFRGVIDPQLFGTARADPLNALRALLLDLRDAAADPVVSTAQRRVAGAIARLLLSWPGVETIGLDGAEQSDLLRQTPTGGTATMGIRADGAFEYGYTVAY